MPTSPGLKKAAANMHILIYMTALSVGSTGVGIFMTSIVLLLNSILLARTGAMKISSLAWGFSPIKIHFSDYSKSLISRINELYVFFNKIQRFVLLQSHLLLCWHGFCDVSVTLCKVSITLSK